MKVQIKVEAADVERRWQEGEGKCLGKDSVTC